MMRYYTLLPQKYLYIQNRTEEEAFKKKEIVLSAPNKKILYAVCIKDKSFSLSEYTVEEHIKRNKVSTFLLEYQVKCVGTAQKDFYERGEELYLIIIPQAASQVRIYIRVVAEKFVYLKQLPKNLKKSLI
jgi:hypothetical protein